MKYFVDQFVNTLQYGDAISGEVLTINRVLRESGINSDIVSLHTHEKYKGLTISPEEFLNKRQEIKNNAQSKHALINHFSISSHLNEIFKEISDVKKVLIYHNMTPSKWYQGYNARVYEDLEKGKDELSSLREIVDFAVADSNFNANELAELNFKNVEVLNLPLDPKRWKNPANEGIRKVLSNGSTNILHVGRFAPNKKIEEIIKIFYYYHFKINKNSKLWLVGSDTDTEIYSFELRRLVSRLSLQNAVNFCGTVSDTELKSFYECADVYLCTSEHEGFCVPVIEAFHFNVPVISFGGSALTETLGKGAIIIENKDVALAAYAIDQILENKTFRENLISSAREGLSRFDIEKFTSNLNSLIKNKVFAS